MMVPWIRTLVVGIDRNGYICEMGSKAPELVHWLDLEREERCFRDDPWVSASGNWVDDSLRWRTPGKESIWFQVDSR